MFDLTGKQAVVGGSAGLIGQAVVTALHKQHCHVACVDTDYLFTDGDIANFTSRLLISKPLRQYQILVNVAYPKSHTDHINCFLNATENMAEYMKASYISGTIINIASIYGIKGSDMRLYEGTDMDMPTHYAAAKGAIIALTRDIATKYGKHGIRANCVSPGGVFDSQPEEFVRRYVDRVPLNRMATPEDVAAVCVFLASDEASYITGQNIVVDGGVTSW